MAINFRFTWTYHATTPVDPRVLEAMTPYFTQHFGNARAATIPSAGKRKEAVEKARKQVADLIGANREGDRVHERRDRIGKPRDQGRRGDVREKGNHIIRR